MQDIVKLSFCSGDGETRGHGPHFTKVFILSFPLFTHDCPQYRSFKHIAEGQTGFNGLVFVDDVNVDTDIAPHTDIVRCYVCVLHRLCVCAYN